MKRPNPYDCDYCGTQKKASNNWYLRVPETHLVTEERGGFVILPWDDELAAEEDDEGKSIYEHICSESCATKALSRYMAARQQKATADTRVNMAFDEVERLELDAAN